MSHRIFQLPSEFRHEIQQALAAENAYVKVFDATLEHLQLHQEPALGLLKQLFARGPHFKLQILLHSDTWLKSRAARLVSLLESHATQVEIRITVLEATKAEDSFVITPTWVVRKRVSSHPSGVAYVDHPQEVEIQTARWNALWASSENALSFRPLGL